MIMRVEHRAARARRGGIEQAATAQYFLRRTDAENHLEDQQRQRGLVDADTPQGLLDGLRAQSDVLEEARGVLTSPQLAALFGPNTLAEVPVTAQYGDLRLYGVIDRLVIEPGRVLAVDHKSNTRVPAEAKDTPEGLLRQKLAHFDFCLQLPSQRPGSDHSYMMFPIVLRDEPKTEHHKEP